MSLRLAMTTTILMLRRIRIDTFSPSLNLGLIDRKVKEQVCTKKRKKSVIDLLTRSLERY